MTRKYFKNLFLQFRVGRQSHRVPHAHHHEERQGNRRHVIGFRRLRQHGARGCHRVRVDARRKKDHQARPDPAQREQHHDGKTYFTDRKIQIFKSSRFRKYCVVI